MLYGIQVTVCSEINTKQIKRVSTVFIILSVKPDGARNQ